MYCDADLVACKLVYARFVQALVGELLYPVFRIDLLGILVIAVTRYVSCAKEM